MNYRAFLIQDKCKVWLANKIDPQNCLIVDIVISKLLEQYLGIVYSTSHLNINREELESQIKARFGYDLKLNFKYADRSEYPLSYLIASLVKQCQNQLPTAIYRKVQAFSKKLDSLNGINGYIIRVAGKLTGPKHSTKKLISGINKYTGSYVNKHLILKTLHIPTKQGVIGIKLRINSASSMPGRFDLKDQYMKESSDAKK